MIVGALGCGYLLLRLVPVTMGAALAWLGNQSVLWLLVPVCLWFAAGLRASKRWSDPQHLLDVISEIEARDDPDGLEGAPDDSGEGLDDLIDQGPRPGRPPDA